jgi:hypothetical protein
MASRADVKRNVLALVIFVSSAAAQQGKIDPNAVPVEKEPQHHLVFANDSVRVIDARLPHGYKSLSHTHSQDNVAITISPGREDAQSIARIGCAGFSKGGYSHAVTNSGTIELRFIAVEILSSPAKSGAVAVANEPRHTLETENERVRIYRVKLASGESLTSHTHSAGWLGVIVKGGSGPGTFQWYGPGSPNPIVAGQSELEIVELEPR